jgi:hypothetical protein
MADPDLPFALTTCGRHDSKTQPLTSIGWGFYMNPVDKVNGNSNEFDEFSELAIVQLQSIRKHFSQIR